MEANKANANANNNVLTAKTLANIKKQAAQFIGGFRAACMAVLEVANNGDADAKKLCAYLGINAESIKNKNISETRKNILNRLPFFYEAGDNNTRFPARLKKVNSDMKAAGFASGYIAVKDTYLNALITLGGLLSKGNEYTQIELQIAESSAAEIADMTAENTTCAVYDKEGAKIGDSTESYIKYKQAKKAAAEKAKTAGTIAYADALK